MIIREMVKEDKNMVEEFFGKMGGESRAFFNRGNGNYNFTMRFFEGEDLNTKFFIAEENGEMLGYVFLMDINTLIPLLGIAVNENYKGRGIGFKLMKYAEEYSVNHKKGGIVLTTHTANIRGQSLYEKCGFEKIGIHGASGEFFYMKKFPDTD